jgi:ABC-2 type transport system ATP-binding protein
MVSENAIVINDLKKSFKDVVVLEGIDLTVRRGTVFALLGPNGAGKTTTVRILSTLLPPDSGYIAVNGYDVVREADKVRSSIGLSGQFAAVDELLTGFENLEMMGQLYRLSPSQSRSRAKELLEQFELVEAAARPVKTYSGGMRRRLDLAASLVAKPPILFLDEPTTGLDPRSRLVMWDIIKELVTGGTTILLTTQYLDEADQLADRIVVIDVGKVIAEGTSDELKQQVGGERLELTVAEADDFERACQVIVGEMLHTDAERRTISLAAKDGMKQFKQLLDRLDDADIDVEDLSLRRPTLDDVFLTLTGHGAAREAEEGEEPTGVHAR